MLERERCTVICVSTVCFVEKVVFEAGRRVMPADLCAVHTGDVVHHISAFFTWGVVLNTGRVPPQRVWDVAWAWWVVALWTVVFSVCSGML